MKFFNNYLPIIMLLTFFTSCFQVVEEVNVKSDASGTAKITLNLSQSKTKLASVMMLDKVNGHKIPKEPEIRAKMLEAVKMLQKQQGISQVQQSLDMKNYIASISFAFKNVSNINQVTQAILKDLKVKGGGQSAYYYTPATKTFTRQYKYAPEANKNYNALKPEDKKIFENAIYTAVYRFDHKVISNSNTKAKISASGKAVMLQCPVLGLVNGQTDITNQVKLSN